MSQDSRIEEKAAGRRRPSLPVVVLMVAVVLGVAGVAWSQRELLNPGEQGALVEALLETDPIKRQLISYATVQWRFQPDGPFGPEIVADIAVPERRQNISFALRKNTDDELPASHIIEILTKPPTFPGRSITAIPQTLVRDAPDRRGTPLIGAAVTVDEARFWVALSGERFDTSANLGLLRGGEVFELSMTYDTGRPAVLLFEKGESGRRAFEEAFLAWGQSGSP